MALTEIELARARRAMDAFMQQRRPPHIFARSWILGSVLPGKALKFSRSDRSGGDLPYFSTRTPNKTLAAKIESKKLQGLIEQSELGLLKSVTIRVALNKYIQSMSHSKEINNSRPLFPLELQEPRCATRTITIPQSAIAAHWYDDSHQIRGGQSPWYDV